MARRAPDAGGLFPRQPHVARRRDSPGRAGSRPDWRRDVGQAPRIPRPAAMTMPATGLNAPRPRGVRRECGSFGGAARLACRAAPIAAVLQNLFVRSVIRVN